MLLQSQNQLSQTHQAQSAVNIDINQRSREITQIASSISELAELFRDLGQMVVEQGTVLDSVEWNVMEAAKEVKGGEEELVVARRSVYLISNSQWNEANKWLGTNPIRLGENVSSSCFFAYSPSSLFSSTSLARILPLLPPPSPHPCYHQILQLHHRLGESQRLV